MTAIDTLIATWLRRDPDANTRAELQALVANDNRAAIADAFSGRLVFGTAGLRGILGVGPARMNRLVVRETTAGLAAYLSTKVVDAAGRGVVVAHDSRRLSPELARDTATVCAALGIKVYLFDHMVPTPLCAFAVRDLKAAAGVVITASHNPANYNGYKVYWESGAQILTPHDLGIAAAIDTAASEDIPWCAFDDARASGLIVSVGQDIIERYLVGLFALSIHPRHDARARLRIAYTPLHGVGDEIAEKALRGAGFTDVRAVPTQRAPDCEFPTTHFPNPEEPGTLTELLNFAAREGADLALANDPDADRLAVAFRTPSGAYRTLTGNEVGLLLAHDRVAQARPNGLFVSSIVSSRQLGVMARAHGIAHVATLTGFKWIARAAMDHERQGGHFVFGYEEALGYCIGNLVRDKDGISALVAMAELVAALAARGETLLADMERIARAYGLYKTHRCDLASDASPLGERLRAAPPSTLATRRVLSTTDVLHGYTRFADGRQEALTLPASDVLIYSLDDDARVIVRPSGTEPKVKCYYEVHDTVAKNESFDVAELRVQQTLTNLVEAHQAEIAALIAHHDKSGLDLAKGDV